MEGAVVHPVAAGCVITDDAAGIERPFLCRLEADVNLLRLLQPERYDIAGSI